MKSTTKAYLDALAWRTGLDSGGYAWDDGAELGLPGTATTGGDVESFIGSLKDCGVPDEHINGSCAFLAFSENSGHFPGFIFPETLPGDPEWSGYYRRRATGRENEVDRECGWCGEEDDKKRAECQRCEGSGYIDCPGGEWAWYTFEEVEEEE